MTDAIVNRLELLTEAVGRLVVEAKIESAHENELRALVERGVAALECIARSRIDSGIPPHRLDCDGNPY
jgi:hypothetical protein